ncbi:Uncharacterized protein APZ42_018457 [Daphnia magna]|uniref:Uncharacterized protein n=1 Tax=Daphnia magna TaxID=35525 RepID=A0A164Z395_9CRUS|nr:Uncharacterized protein APZ42_018457 [Daphnia magna]
MRKWSDRVTTRHGQARHAAVSETSTVIIIHTSLCFFLFCLYFFPLSTKRTPHYSQSHLLANFPYPFATRVWWCFVRKVSAGDDGDNKHELRKRIASTFR